MISMDYQPITGIEPRFQVLKQELEHLLRLVDLECDGEVVEPSGFRLKDLNAWNSNNIANPMDAVGALSGTCNSHCKFCFERSHPFVQDKSILSIEEAATRLRHYDPQSGKGLFPSSRVFKETFVNPHVLPILRMIRDRAPEQPLWLTSNGSFLSKETIECLAGLKPLMIKLSLNSADADMRNRIMGGNSRPGAALKAPEELRRHGIPFIGSVVAWPSLMPHDLVSTLHYLDQYEPYAIRVRLPLYHRYLHSRPPFDGNFWDEVIALCGEMKRQLASPLYIEPSLYWINAIMPEIDGVVRNSPADLAHLRTGDRIISIDGDAVSTRIQALGLLVKAYSEGKPSITLRIEHADSAKPETVTLKPHSAVYPYTPEILSPNERYGIIFLDDFRLQYIEDICHLIKEHNSHFPMLFTSKAVEPIVRAVIAGVPIYEKFFSERRLSIETIRETALGGNFSIMDGRIVADFIKHIKDVRSRSGKLPDLVLIPNAFGNPWGIDYFQESFKQIERLIDAPVELIDWPILYGREI